MCREALRSAAFPESSRGDGERITDQRVELLAVGAQIKKDKELRIVRILLKSISVPRFPIDHENGTRILLVLEFAFEDLFQSVNCPVVLNDNNSREVNSVGLTDLHPTADCESPIRSLFNDEFILNRTDGRG
jgi:hypothetical protein